MWARSRMGVAREGDGSRARAQVYRRPRSPVPLPSYWKTGSRHCRACVQPGHMADECLGRWLTHHHGGESATREAATPWRKVSVMVQRREFVKTAMKEGANRRELCWRFGISAQICYKWLARFAAGDAVLAACSRDDSAARQRHEDPVPGRTARGVDRQNETPYMRRRPAAPARARAVGG